MSIVAMKRNMEAKRGLSSGGGGFSLNPKYRDSNASSTSVKSAAQARKNAVKRSVCFNSRDGVQCEKVWDGKKQPDNCKATGEAMTHEEYIEKKRYSAADC